MKAKQKIEQIDVGSFGLNLENRLEIIEVNDPPERKPGIMVQMLKN